MKKSRFTPKQILQGVREAEGRTFAGEIGRKLVVTEATFYRWRKQYAGLDVGELRELRARREETLSGDRSSPIWCSRSRS